MRIRPAKAASGDNRPRRLSIGRRMLIPRVYAVNPGGIDRLAFSNS